LSSCGLVSFYSVFLCRPNLGYVMIGDHRRLEKVKPHQE
jgi:hypothetical protein